MNSSLVDKKNNKPRDEGVGLESYAHRNVEQGIAQFTALYSRNGARVAANESALGTETPQKHIARTSKPRADVANEALNDTVRKASMNASVQIDVASNSATTDFVDLWEPSVMLIDYLNHHETHEQVAVNWHTILREAIQEGEAATTDAVDLCGSSVMLVDYLDLCETHEQVAENWNSILGDAIQKEAARCLTKAQSLKVDEEPPYSKHRSDK